MNVWSSLWNGIVDGLNFILQALYKLTGNYGVATILLTVLVKLVLLPLTIKQTRSMIAMQKIQPEIKKLQEKYKDDRERLSQEMMKFYKENKVNPLGGCLPLLLQMPIFFALFTVLRKYLLTAPTLMVGNTYAVFKGLPQYAAGLPGAYEPLPIVKPAGFLWIKNLADSTRLADPTFILIILLAATTYYSQKQVMTDPRQKNMMIIMPLITAFIGWSLPAGVALYWLTTNTLQILQQFAMERYDKKHPREETKGGEKGKKEAEKAGARTQESEKKAPPEKTKPAKGAPSKATTQQQKTKGAGAQQKGKQGKSTMGKGAPPSKGSNQKKKPKTPPPQQKKNPGAPKKGDQRKR